MRMIGANVKSSRIIAHDEDDVGLCLLLVGSYWHGSTTNRPIHDSSTDDHDRAFEWRDFRPCFVTGAKARANLGQR
jgi:hypothetical protein